MQFDINLPDIQTKKSTPVAPVVQPSSWLSNLWRGTWGWLNSAPSRMPTAQPSKTQTGASTFTLPAFNTINGGLANYYGNSLGKNPAPTPSAQNPISATGATQYGPQQPQFTPVPSNFNAATQLSAPQGGQSTGTPVTFADYKAPTDTGNPYSYANYYAAHPSAVPGFTIGNQTANFSTADLSGTPKTPYDIATLIKSYQDAAAPSAQELQYQQDLLNAQTELKNYQLSALSGERSAIYQPIPLQEATGQAGLIQDQAALGSMALSNKADIAQRALQIEQANRQIRTGVAQNVLNLAKPTELSPGSSLVNSFGQTAYQGSGFRAPSPADILSLTNAYVGQGMDFQSAQAKATADLASFGGYGTSGHSTTGGNIPQTLNNPGAIRFANQPGATMGPNGFATFTSPEAGFAALQADLLAKMSGRTGTGLNSQSTLGQLISTWAPSSDGNDPVGYANRVASMLGVNVNTPIGSLVGRLPDLAHAIATQEGFYAQKPSDPRYSMLSGYLTTGPNNTPYINGERVASNQENAVKNLAAQLGIPFLNREEVGKLRSIDVTTQNLNQMSQAIQGLLQPGVFGRIVDVLKTKISDWFQTNPDIASFRTYRDTAINAIQALAGGQGFRLTQAEIDTATGNLPTTSDNLETATKKLATIQGFINRWIDQLLPNQQVAYGQDNSGQYGSADPLGIR